MLCESAVTLTAVAVAGSLLSIPVAGSKCAPVQHIDQKLPDPILEEFARLNRRIEALERQLDVKACRYSITQDNDVVERSGENAIEEEIEELEKHKKL